MGFMDSLPAVERVETERVLQFIGVDGRLPTRDEVRRMAIEVLILRDMLERLCSKVGVEPPGDGD